MENYAMLVSLTIPSGHSVVNITSGWTSTILA